MKVHITLNDDVRADAKAKREALERLGAVVQLSDLNMRRFDRHGIISADVPESAVETIEGLSDVRSVSVDRAQHVLTGR